MLAQDTSSVANSPHLSCFPRNLPPKGRDSWTRPQQHPPILPSLAAVEPV